MKWFFLLAAAFCSAVSVERKLHNDPGAFKWSILAAVFVITSAFCSMGE